MIPLTTLYDECIDRSNLTEQKNLFEYIAPPPQEESEQKSFRIATLTALKKKFGFLPIAVDQLFRLFLAKRNAKEASPDPVELTQKQLLDSATRVNAKSIVHAKSIPG